MSDIDIISSLVKSDSLLNNNLIVIINYHFSIEKSNEI